MPRPDMTTEAANVSWSYRPECAPHPQTAWEYRIVWANGRISEGTGRASNARHARRQLRRAIKRAEGGRP